MSLDASNDYRQVIQEARSLIKDASYEKGKQQSDHLKEANALLTQLWSGVKGGDNSLDNLVGKDLSIKNLQKKLSIVEKALPQLETQRDLNLRSPSINNPMGQEVYSPTGKKPAKKATDKPVQKPNEVSTEQKEFEALGEKYIELFTAFNKGGSVDVKDLSDLKRKIGSHLSHDGGLREDWKVLSDSVEALSKEISFPLPIFYQDEATIRRQPLEHVAQTLVELMEASDSDPSRAQRLEKTVEVYTKVFYEKAKEARSAEDLLTVYGAICTHVKPMDHTTAERYGSICALLLAGGESHLYRAQLQEIVPRIHYTMLAVYKDAFLRELKRSLEWTTNDYSPYREEFLARVYGTNKAWQGLTDLERSTLIDFWKMVKPLPEGTPKNIKEMRQRTESRVPKE